ncbi:MAG: formate--tetrahydrofolate ligase [Kordiimonadaceae bacterium]|jgi:formate--tetrahydrofolate ligase|nr:formate--tetrahydrofolate ligase [Kordiimonadaceae bacterium]MDB4043888.1 formate--tetrahydrofolate ligase [Emcibacteraceae bacterium]MBT6466945.1 formate--tetrahydrofolate ligase [Kordiimonadaceae bacterium]MBT7544815.1 formate--tetrahydrofolate ligase [Kordiimonadaceae bacterium]MDB4218950.1 formate--tetrahydrofolate ligase [Emcibacteraceae bacterium]
MTKDYKSDIEIAREAKAKPIGQIAEKIGIPDSALIRYGDDKAKVSLEYIESLEGNKDGKLILVTAITPTPAGEGKTTTTVGLGDGLNKIGKKAMICIREPSLGPCFGMKGGAAGGGYAQVIPMEDINLHFTGDFHAITSANNLLAAMIDNHNYWGNSKDLDSRRITWRRVMDMNDRSLRQITTSLGGIANGFPREGGFDITPASEVMAIFCLASSLADLRRRLGSITIGQTRNRKNVYASEIKADGPMTVLLKDALQPNLVQTLEHNPAFIHGGPFANIAHGCNTVMATKAALKMTDYVVTEAGFGADLGAEKFFDIKCRKAGLKPDCVVLVATVRALKMHGGIGKDDLASENLGAVEKGLENLERHAENIRKFGVEAVVGINRFPTDTDDEIAVIVNACSKVGIKAVESYHWAHGSDGSVDLARAVVKTIDEGKADFRVLYPDNLNLLKKIEVVAKEIYRANEVIVDQKIKNQLIDFEKDGFGHLPVCMAKTQYSFSTDPALKGSPTGYNVPIREVRISSGAEFILVVCGAIMTMPGLPRVPAAEAIELDKNGLVQGLF